jgi:hypothetical protein
MTAIVSGFCMTCKKYGIIANCQKEVMKNGRTRAYGYCSQKQCAGKISKIIS